MKNTQVVKFYINIIYNVKTQHRNLFRELLSANSIKIKCERKFNEH